MKTNVNLKRVFSFLMALAMVLTLMVATPVSGEFRYAYGLFTAFPLVICACLYGKPEEKI